MVRITCWSEGAELGLKAPLQRFVDYGDNLKIGRRGDPILLLKGCPALIVKNKSLDELKKLRELVKQSGVDLDIEIVGSSERCYFVNIVVIDSEKVSTVIFEAMKGFLSERKIPSAFRYDRVDERYRCLHKNTYEKLVTKVLLFFESNGYKTYRESGYFDARGYTIDNYYVYKVIGVHQRKELGETRTVEETSGFVVSISNDRISFVEEKRVNFTNW